MRSDQVLQAIIAVLTLLFLVTSALTALVVKIVIRWTKTEDTLAKITDNMERLVADKDRVHREITDQMREDRKANNDRIIWLERNLWERRKHGGNSV